MKKMYALFSLLFLFVFLTTAEAKILRVGYNGIQLAGVDYNDITLANNAANAGDTIQIYGTQSGNVTKQLVIMGFGYNFDVHPGLQAIGTDAPSGGWITFQAGSEGSVIEGCHSDIQLYTSDITIRRCFGSVLLVNNNSSINNIKIISSVVTNANMYNTTLNCTNFQMFNSIIYSLNFYGSGSNGVILNCVTPPSTNVFNFNNSGFLVKNSILYSPGANVNTVWENNFFQVSQPSELPQGSNNRWGQSYANIFERLGGSNDNPAYYSNSFFDENYYVLKAGSPAIGGGFDGANNVTDCGIFGGEPLYKYVISGVPAVPAIYQVLPASGSATTNPYNVTISVRSNQ